jgi:hypothetical protein
LHGPRKAENVAAAHDEAHGMIPTDIFDASEDEILRFLGRIHEPANASEITSAFRTIVFTDLEDSTTLAQELDSQTYIALLREHDGIIRRALVSSHGREVKHTGDGIMASFEGVESALDFAIAIKAGFAERIAAGGEPPYKVRIGMAAGEPVDHNDDLFGSTVNLEPYLRRGQSRRGPRLGRRPRPRCRNRLHLRGLRRRQPEGLRRGGLRLQTARKTVRSQELRLCGCSSELRSGVDKPPTAWLSGR